MQELLVATTNAGKLREITAILKGLPLRLKTLADFPNIQIAEETGLTFADNARQKALHYAGITGMLAMAEDSGFVVDAIGGEPGIYSARYLREDASYPERFGEIYRSVQASGVRETAARFVCSVAMAHEGRIAFETTASVEGRLHSVRVGRAELLGPGRFAHLAGAWQLH